MVEELKRLGLGVVVNGIWVGVMLYADDMALLARSAGELQKMLDVVVEFSNKWRFVLSGKKSEVMVVGAKVRERDVWKMGGHVLKVVKEFKYLGVEIQQNGRWTAVCKRLCEKAEKRVQVMVGMGMRQAGFSVKTGVSLWGSLVVPIMEYGSEVWSPGVAAGEKFEQVQKRAGKQMLGCSSKMADEVVRGELGWGTMEGRREVLKLRFFGRLVRMERCRVVRQVFVMRKGSWQEGEWGWFEEVHGLLRKYGLEEWWEEEKWRKFPKKKEWEKLVEEAVEKEEEEKWKEGMAAKATLENYARVKKRMGLEDYLARANGYRPGTVLRTKLRGGTNALRVSQGRQSRPKLERHERVCLVCNSGQVEDEAHFVMDCAELAKARAAMWKRIMGAVRKEPEAARALRLMNRAELFDFILGQKQEWVVNDAVNGAIAKGLAEMYEARKAILFDTVFKVGR